VHDMAVPRSVWDDDLLRQVGLLLEAHASDPDLVKIFDRVNAEVPLKGGGR
jgi:hypothetical protein